MPAPLCLKIDMYRFSSAFTIITLRQGLMALVPPISSVGLRLGALYWALPSTRSNAALQEPGCVCYRSKTLLVPYCRAVGHYLRRAGHNGRGGKAQVDNGVRTHSAGLVDHALNGDVPGLVHHGGVGLELAAHQGFQALANVVAKVFGLDGAAHGQAQNLDLLAGDGLCGGN